MLKGFPFLLTVEDGMSETAEAIEALAKQRVINPSVDGCIERLDVVR